MKNFYYHSLVFGLLAISTSCSMQTGKLLSTSDEHYVLHEDVIVAKKSEIPPKALHQATASDAKNSAESLQPPVVLAEMHDEQEANDFWSSHAFQNPTSALPKANQLTRQTAMQRGKLGFFKKLANKNPHNSLAIASFVLAVMTFIPPLVWLGFPALTTGAVALRQIKRAPDRYTNRWMAKFGVIIGMVVSIISVILLLGLALLSGLPEILLLLMIPGGIILANMIVSIGIMNGE
ncbi:MAG: DUF4190 domain-containing protein [Sphingobacteriaceae bacterium]|nr:DUF4190 domain-containing protein [Sphingobacteriaceae bacterium]